MVDNDLKVQSPDEFRLPFLVKLGIEKFMDIEGEHDYDLSHDDGIKMIITSPKTNSALFSNIKMLNEFAEKHEMTAYATFENGSTSNIGLEFSCPSKVVNLDTDQSEVLSALKKYVNDQIISRQNGIGTSP